MSTRPMIGPYPVITNGDMSGNLTSLITIIKSLSLVSYSLTWSGTAPVGNISVQVSNDYSITSNGEVNNPGTWNTLPLSASTAVTGNNGMGFIDIDANAGYALRVVYTKVSGIGSLNVIVAGKVS